MMQLNRSIASQLPQPGELCTSYLEYAPMELLEKLADHPNGSELLKSFQEFYRDVRTATRPTIELVKGRAASRVVLIDALSLAQELVIIASPWLSKRSLDSELLLRMTALLERGCCLHIGWGYSYDIRGMHTDSNIINVSRFGQCFIDVTADKAGNYSAFPELDKLRARYPDQIELKLLGTHEKYVICDKQFALLGSHNVLSSLDTLFAPREMGWKTREGTLMEAQIEDFMKTPDHKHDRSLWSELNSDGQFSPLLYDKGDPKLVREALKVVRQRGIVNPPFFKTMKNSDIQAFIAQYSEIAVVPNSVSFE